MRQTPRTLLSALVLVLLAVPPGRAADDSTGAEHPLAAGKLSLRDGATGRRVLFRGRWQPAADMGNPIYDGATVRVSGRGPSDGDSGLVRLNPSRWSRMVRRGTLAGYQYDDPTGSAGGVRSIVLKSGRKAGTVKITGGGAEWAYAIAGKQSEITVTLTVGRARWCTVFDGNLVRTGKGRVSAQRKGAPASCPCARADGTFAAIQQAVFARYGCTDSVCHGASAQGGLDLRPEVAYQNLVDVPSALLPGQQRVEPGSKDRSLLYRKLAAATLGTTVEGTPMPNGRRPLAEAELQAIQRWIQVGAPETGVVRETEALLDACLPPPDPIKIRAPAPPPVGQGVQFHAPPWTIPPHGENEVCYATYYDFSNDLTTVPASVRTPCVDFWGGPSRECFFYDRAELTQDPNSHHSIIHLYQGAFDSARPGFALYTCQGGGRGVCDPADPHACEVTNAGGTVTAQGTCADTPFDIRDREGLGPFTCQGGDQDGQPCDPLGLGVPAPAGADCGPGGGCAGRVQRTIACAFYGPPDFGIDFRGRGTTSAPSFGGSQQPLALDDYAPGVARTLPVRGFIVWNSHAFNLEDRPTTNEQWYNLTFAPPEDRIYPLLGIFEAQDIFVMDVPPFEKREYCRTFTLPKGSRLTQFSSHTHKRGKLFRIFGPGIIQRCGTGPSRPIKPADCLPRPEDGEPFFTTTQYNDPTQLRFDPPREFDSDDEDSRTFKFCSVYDNGASDPDNVKRQSTSPVPPFALAFLGGPCSDTEVVCLAGPKKGQKCQGDDRACDSAAGANDGVCDACPVHGGVTTEDEMFILLGDYYNLNVKYPGAP